MTTRRRRARGHARFSRLLLLTTILSSSGVLIIEAPSLAQNDPVPATPKSEPAASSQSSEPRTVIPAPPPGSTQADPAVAKYPPEKLESLVAPIALYPDPLLGQVLVASTYPLEIMEAQQWVAKNPNLKGDALMEAAKKQTWDPSVQSMVAFPDVMKRMTENISWTSDLGNAVLAQQSDVMDAVQRLRKQAKDSGKLVSNEQQTVTTQVVEKETVVVVQPAKTQVVYVPVYDPALVWGPAPYYHYPPLYYPPPPPVGTMLVSFGVGMMVGAAIHGGWGYNTGWGHSHGTVVVNNHNTFVKNNNVVNRNNVSAGNSTWQHNPRHRGSVPYQNADVSRRYAGSGARQSGAGLSDRPSNASAGDRDLGAKRGPEGADRNSKSPQRETGSQRQAESFDRGSDRNVDRGSNRNLDRGSSGRGSSGGFNRSGGGRRGGGGRR